MTEKADISRFVLMEKKVLDEYIRVMREVNSALVKLWDERERILSKLRDAEKAGDDVLAAANRLREMYEEVLLENSKLAAALGDVSPPSKKELN